MRGVRVLVARGDRWMADVAVGEIADELDRHGIVCLRDAVSVDWLDAVRAHVESRFSTAGRGSAFVVGAGEEPNTPAYALATDPQVVALLQGLARARRRRRARSAETIRTALNIVAHSSPSDAPPRFHYDASTVAMVVPVVIPAAAPGNSGELVAFANQRPFRRFVAVNIVEKALTQNMLYSRRAMHRYRCEPTRHTVDLQPGNAYLFWGYRTLHTVLGCAPSDSRVTLLLHCGSPHGTSRALAGAKWLSRAVTEDRAWRSRR